MTLEKHFTWITRNSSIIGMKCRSSAYFTFIRRCFRFSIRICCRRGFIRRIIFFLLTFFLHLIALRNKFLQLRLIGYNKGAIYSVLHVFIERIYVLLTHMLYFAEAMYSNCLHCPNLILDIVRYVYNE